MERLIRQFRIALARGDRVAAWNIRAKIKAAIPPGVWKDFYSQFYDV